MSKEVFEKRVCPYCEASDKQHSIGLTPAGSKRFRCGICKRDYTPKPKKWGYSKEEKEQALRLLALGNTGRGVGKAMNMNKANVYRWATEVAKKRT